MKLYQALATAIQAKANCLKSGNEEWYDRWSVRIECLTDKHLPHGGGFDAGTNFDEDRSTANKLVFHTSFHHMNANGYYTRWTEHTLIARPSFIHDFEFSSISGINHNGIKDYLAEYFNSCLDTDVEWEK